MLGCDHKLFHGDHALHARPIQLGRKGYFDNWEGEKETLVFFLSSTPLQPKHWPKRCRLPKHKTCRLIINLAPFPYPFLGGGKAGYMGTPGSCFHLSNTWGGGGVQRDRHKYFRNPGKKTTKGVRRAQKEFSLPRVKAVNKIKNHRKWSRKWSRLKSHRSHRKSSRKSSRWLFAMTFKKSEKTIGFNVFLQKSSQKVIAKVIAKSSKVIANICVLNLKNYKKFPESLKFCPEHWWFSFCCFRIRFYLLLFAVLFLLAFLFS